MSKSVLSARAFAIYLFIVGPMLVIAPNVLLAIFRLPGTTEIWIRIIGVLAFNIGVFAWVSAESRNFLKASVYTRCIFFLATLTFAALGLASPMIIFFGVTDLLGATWTHFALKAEARASSPVFAGNHPQTTHARR